MHEYLQEFRRVVDYEVNLRKQPLLSPEESEQFNLLSPEEREQLLSKRRQDRIHSGIGLRAYDLSHTSLSEWRQEWVDVFSSLCEPLYKFISLCEPTSVSLFLTTEDQKATLNCFERFCVETSMNHLLDSEMSVFLLSDCIVSLAYLIDRVLEKKYTDTSFHFQRLSHHRRTMVHIMVNNGFWRGTASDRTEYLKALHEVPFPFEKYFDMSDWKRIG